MGGHDGGGVVSLFRLCSQIERNEAFILANTPEVRAKVLV